MSALDVSLTLPEGTAGRAFSWIHHGAPRLTVVVKTSATLIHGQPARRIASEPIVEDGHTGELAPFLNGVGVTIVGRPGRLTDLAREGRPVRLRAALARGPVLWQKRVELVATDPRLRDDAFARALMGPWPRIDPRRRQCLGRLAQELEPRLSRFSPNEPLSLPDGFDFRYFHSAPPDQQLGRIMGDEWLVLEGFERLDRLETQLSTGPWLLRWIRDNESPIAIDGSFDSVTVDVDRGVLSLLWRATFVVPVNAPPTLFLQVLPSRPAAPSSPSTDPPSSRPSPIPSVAGGATVLFAEAPALPASLPFASLSRPRSTKELDPGELAKAIMPFDAKPIPSPRDGSREVRPPLVHDRAPPASGLTATLLPHEVMQISEPARPLPFQKSHAGAPLFAPAPASVAAPPPIAAVVPAVPPVTTPAPAPIAAESPRPNGDDLLRARLSGPHRPFFEALLRGETTFYGVDLSGADLNDLDLSGRILSRGNLRGAKLQRANLRGARLSEAKLDDADLTAACLAGADLTGASLARACLEHVDATGATLEGASLERARATHARLDRARGAKAVFARGKWDDSSFVAADLRGADLSGASFARADLAEADLTQARLGDIRAPAARFERAKLDHARLDGAALEGIEARSASAQDASWERTDLRGACLENAVLSNGRFTRAHLDDARLGHAILAGVSLQGATARNARFERADLTGADLRQLQAARACFEGATLQGAQGARADLSDVSLREAKLDGASFRPAQLARADLSGASLAEADLRDANLEGANLTRTVRRGTKLAGAKLKSIIE